VGGFGIERAAASATGSELCQRAGGWGLLSREGAEEEAQPPAVAEDKPTAMETEDMVAEGASAPEAAEEENPAETEEAASGGVDGVSLALCLLPEIPEDRQSLERRDFCSLR